MKKPDLAKLSTAKLRAAERSLERRILRLLSKRARLIREADSVRLECEKLSDARVGIEGELDRRMTR